jgi:branched-chain amino acid aminotransferase
MTNVLDLVAYKNGEYKSLGEIGPNVLDFGFIHCDATYDVMPVYNGKAFCYEKHLQRFKNSAERYGLELPDVDTLEIIKELAKRNTIENAFVWFLVWRGYPPSGNPRDIENCPINFAMYIKPSYPIGKTSVVSIVLDEYTNRVNDDYYGQEFKNMAWIELTMSQRNRPKGFDTTVLVDIDGCITEGPGFNVGIVDKGVIYTADRNVLKGITMSVVEDICEDTPGQFTRCHLKEDVWNFADEIFLTSSSGGVTATQRTGKVTEWLQREYIERTKHYDYITEL